MRTLPIPKKKQKNNGMAFVSQQVFGLLFCFVVLGMLRECSTLEWAPWAPCQVESGTQADPVWGPRDSLNICSVSF